MMNKCRTLFIGTSEFAREILANLIKLDYIDLSAVITQPDKPAGRKMELKSSPVKEYILQENLKLDLLQPEKLKVEAKEILEKYSPEIIIVAAYGQIVPKIMLNTPKYGAINIHGSILPKLRGAVPIQMAILQGFTETGISIQKMVFKMDAGPIICEKKLQISEDDTFESLLYKLANISNLAINQCLLDYLKGGIKPQSQDEREATFCYKTDIDKTKAQITYKTDFRLAERMIRAFYPWPVAWIKLDTGKILKIYKAAIFKDLSLVNKDNLVQKIGKSLVLNLENGSLELLEVQLEGKNRADASNYLYLGI